MENCCLHTNVRILDKAREIIILSREKNGLKHVLIKQFQIRKKRFLFGKAFRKKLNVGLGYKWDTVEFLLEIRES